MVTTPFPPNAAENPLLPPPQQAGGQVQSLTRGLKLLRMDSRVAQQRRP